MVGAIVGIWVLLRHRGDVRALIGVPLAGCSSRRRSGGSATTSARSCPAGRIFEELLRIDPHHILGRRLNLYVAAPLCALSAAWFVRTQRLCGARDGKEVDDAATDLDRV